MDVLSLLAALFHWTMTVTPAAVLAVMILLAARSLLRYQISARIFYFLWLVLMLRLAMPWTPSIELFHLPFPSIILQDAGQSVYEGPIAEVAHTNPPSPDPLLLLPPGESSTGKFIWKDILFPIWLDGVFILSILFAFSYVRWRRRLASEHTADVPPDLLKWLAECQLRLNVRQRIELRLSTHLTSPATYGWWKPKILVPANLVGHIDKEDWNTILLHELIHIRRRDALWNGIMTALLLLHWFNPLMWLAWHKMREDQELSCDAIAMNWVNNKRYGSTMIKVLELTSSAGGSALVPFVSGKTTLIKRRIKMIAMKKKSAMTIKAAIIVTVFAIAIFSGVTINAKQQSQALPQVDTVPYILPAEGEITIRYGDPKPFKKETRSSNGLEIVNKEGTPVYAAADGIIEAAGYGKVEGNQVVIAHDGDIESVYMHLKEMLVEAGEEVKQGQQIGIMGSTGQSLGPHLKFQMLKNGAFINPESLIP